MQSSGTMDDLPTQQNFPITQRQVFYSFCVNLCFYTLLPGCITSTGCIDPQLIISSQSSLRGVTSGLEDITMQCVFGESNLSDISEEGNQMVPVIDERLGFGNYFSAIQFKLYLNTF